MSKSHLGGWEAGHLGGLQTSTGHRVAIKAQKEKPPFGGFVCWGGLLRDGDDVRCVEGEDGGLASAPREFALRVAFGNQRFEGGLNAIFVVDGLMHASVEWEEAERWGVGLIVRVDVVGDDFVESAKDAVSHPVLMGFLDESEVVAVFEAEASLDDGHLDDVGGRVFGGLEDDGLTIDDGVDGADGERLYVRDLFG